MEIPPLRERKEDIPVLGRYFGERYCERLNLHPRQIAELNGSGLEIITVSAHFPWSYHFSHYTPPLG